MDDILRFPSAVKHDPAIDAWLVAQRDDLRPLAETWFVRMRQRGGDVALAQLVDAAYVDIRARLQK